MSLRDILTDERLLERIERVNYLLWALAVIGGWLLGSLPVAGGILLGGAIMTASFQTMKWQIRRAFKRAETPSKRALFLRYYVRFFATAFLVLLVVYYRWVDLVAFLIGLSVVMLAIVWVGMQEAVIMMIKGGR